MKNNMVNTTHKLTSVLKLFFFFLTLTILSNKTTAAEFYTEPEVVQLIHGLETNDALSNTQDAYDECDGTLDSKNITYEETLTQLGFVTDDTSNTLVPSDLSYKSVQTRRSAAVLKESLKNKLLHNELWKYVQLGYQIYKHRLAPKTVRESIPLPTHQSMDISKSRYSYLKSPLLCKLLGESEVKPFKLNSTNYNFGYREHPSESVSGVSTSEPEFEDTQNNALYKLLAENNGIDAEQILDVSRILKNIPIHMIQDNAKSESNIFSGLNQLTTEIFKLTQQTSASPVRLKDLTLEQQKSMQTVFMQGSAYCNDKKHKQFQSHFDLTSLGHGGYTALSQFLVLTSNQSTPSLGTPASGQEQHIFFAYDTTKNNNWQLLWIGFDEQHMYFGFYPTEGLLLAYQIPNAHKQTFLAKLIGLLRSDRMYLKQVYMTGNFGLFSQHSNEQVEDVDAEKTIFTFNHGNVEFQQILTDKTATDYDDENNYDIKFDAESGENNKKIKSLTFVATKNTPEIENRTKQSRMSCNFCRACQLTRSCIKNTAYHLKNILFTTINKFPNRVDQNEDDHNNETHIPSKIY